MTFCIESFQNETCSDFSICFTLFFICFYRAGLQAGDIITHINGIPVKQAADLYSLTKPEENTKLALIHEGKKKNINLTADAIILT